LLDGTPTREAILSERGYRRWLIALLAAASIGITIAACGGGDHTSPVSLDSQIVLSDDELYLIAEQITRGALVEFRDFYARVDPAAIVVGRPFECRQTAAIDATADIFSVDCDGSIRLENAQGLILYQQLSERVQCGTPDATNCFPVENYLADAPEDETLTVDP